MNKESRNEGKKPIFPLSDLPTAHAIATDIDLLSYGTDGVRGALIEQWHFGALIDLGVLTIVASCFVALGAWSFSRIQP